ncbi:unnamed protein product [Ostreobium quekettii]|uniref:E3 ubiquitin-protein ligase RNF25 n=1 Tax=Ostreobium quekettii TaxID=121088 RepID=A0A8S1J9J5_9CHLO|nr:unnamed protein product [Ostreobium quekettii]
MADCGDLGSELDALRSTYSGDFEMLSENPVRFRVHIAPSTGQNLHERYVEADLEVGVPEGYPDEPPMVRLRCAKGLGDERAGALLGRLAEEGDGMRGEMMLGRLCDAAMDGLTAMNAPEGDCVFCMEPLVGADLVKMPCFHVFHRSCFPAWWNSQQQSLSQEERELREHTGEAAASRLLKDLPSKEGGFFIVSCPVCRVPITPGDLLPYWSPVDTLLDTSFTKQWSQGGQAGLKDSTLTDCNMALIRKQQAERAALYEAQKAKGAIVGNTVVALSLGAVSETDTAVSEAQKQDNTEEPTDEEQSMVEVDAVQIARMGAHRRAQSHGDLVSKFPSVRLSESADDKPTSTAEAKSQHLHALFKQAFQQPGQEHHQEQQQWTAGRPHGRGTGRLDGMRGTGSGRRRPDGHQVGSFDGYREGSHRRGRGGRHVGMEGQQLRRLSRGGRGDRKEIVSALEGSDVLGETCGDPHSSLGAQGEDQEGGQRRWPDGSQRARGPRSRGRGRGRGRGIEEQACHDGPGDQHEQSNSEQRASHMGPADRVRGYSRGRSLGRSWENHRGRGRGYGRRGRGDVGCSQHGMGDQMGFGRCGARRGRGSDCHGRRGVSPKAEN